MLRERRFESCTAFMGLALIIYGDMGKLRLWHINLSASNGHSKQCNSSAIHIGWQRTKLKSVPKSQSVMDCVGSAWSEYGGWIRHHSLRVAPKADVMSICIGLNARKQKTSRKVANWTVITDVAHFVFQKKMKRMAMHICDMLTKTYCFLYFVYC